MCKLKYNLHKNNMENNNNINNFKNQTVVRTNTHGVDNTPQNRPQIQNTTVRTVVNSVEDDSFDDAFEQLLASARKEQEEKKIAEHKAAQAEKLQPQIQQGQPAQAGRPMHVDQHGRPVNPQPQMQQRPIQQGQPAQAGRPMYVDQYGRPVNPQPQMQQRPMQQGQPAQAGRPMYVDQYGRPVNPQPQMQQRPMQQGQPAQAGRPMYVDQYGRPVNPQPQMQQRPMQQGQPAQAGRPMYVDQYGRPVNPQPQMQQRPMQQGQPAQAGRPIQQASGITMQESFISNVSIADIFDDSLPNPNQQVDDTTKNTNNENSNIVVTDTLENVVDNEAIDLNDIFVEDEQKIYEEEPIESNNIFKDNQVQEEKQYEDLSDIFGAEQQVQEEQQYEDLSDIFGAEQQVQEEQQYEDLSDVFGSEQQVQEEQQYEEVNNGAVNNEELSQKITANETMQEQCENIEIDPTNVFDYNMVPYTKDFFIAEYVQQTPAIYDVNGNLISKEDLKQMIDYDALILKDEFGSIVLKVNLLKEVNAAVIAKQKAEAVDSNVLNEFNKPVTFEEFIKEYHTGNPNLFDVNQTRLEKTKVIDMISSGELFVAEYGVMIPSDMVLTKLKDDTTPVFDNHGNELSKNDIIMCIQNESDLYDKYGNQLTKEDIISKTNEETIVVKDEDGQQVSKVSLLNEIQCYVDLYKINGDKLTKDEVLMYVINNNVNFFDENGKQLKKEKILEVFNEYNIDYCDEFENLLLDEESNIFNEQGDPLNSNEFIIEYRNVLPRLFDVNSKKIAKKDILFMLENDSIKIYDDGELVHNKFLIKEILVNTQGVFTKEREELSKEELLSAIHQKYTVYDFNGNELSVDILINNLQNEINIVYDLNGNLASVAELVDDLNKEYLLIYDFYQNPLSKDEVIDMLNSGNNTFYSDAKLMFSNVELRKFLDENQIEINEQIDELLSNEEDFSREFIDINSDDDFAVVLNEEEYKDIVIARKENDAVVLVTYNESFEARLNLTDDLIKDYYNLLKNILLSFEKAKSKITWNNETFTLGKTTVAKIDVEVNTLYLYLNIKGYNEDNGLKFKDCSSIKAYSSTPARFTISSIAELRAVYSLIENLATTAKVGILNDYYMTNYFEKNRGFDALLTEGLIKEVANSKTSKSLSSINKSTLSGNKITSINRDVVKDIIITNDFYQEVINGISETEKGDNKSIIHTDTISRAFNEGDVVSLETLHKKMLIHSNVNFVRCIARGSIDKKLIFELNDYSKNAVKMIMLTNGTIQ